MTRRFRPALVPIALAVIAVAILLAMGRPAICTCGRVTLWVSNATSPETSQMLADWYSPSHIVHGFLFYALFWLVARRWPVERQLAGALLVEAAWAIVENSPWIIDRYRSATAAVGYSGDSVLNSASDMAMMVVGFLLARRLPLWGAVTALLLLELVPLIVIRDNLMLNIIMLVHPSDAIRQWQAVH